MGQDSSRPRDLAAAMLAVTCVLSACSHANEGVDSVPFKTLDGKPPQVIGHRGLP
jgi:hypothetical protein